MTTCSGTQRFNHDGGGLAKGGTVSSYLDGTAVGEGRVHETADDSDQLIAPEERIPIAMARQ